MNPEIYIGYTQEEQENYLKEQGKTPEQFQKECVERITQFCQERAGRIASCGLSMPLGKLQVIIGMPGRWDDPFADEVTELDLELFHTGWNTSVMQLPLNPSRETLLDFARFVAHHEKTND